MFPALIIGCVLASGMAQGTSAPDDATVSIDTAPYEAHVFLGSSTSDDEVLCTGHCTLKLAPGSYWIRGALRFRSRPGRAAEPLVLDARETRRLRVTVSEHRVATRGGLGLAYVGGALVLAGMVQTVTAPGYDPYDTAAQVQPGRGGPLMGAGTLCVVVGMAVAIFLGHQDVEVRPVGVPIEEGEP